MKKQASDLLRSVLLECQQWRDSYANPYTSARLWINGQVFGTLQARYGHPSELEHYDLAPYLESAGVIPLDRPHPAHISHRLRRLGIDYYETVSQVKKKHLLTHTALEPVESFADSLERIERARARFRAVVDSYSGVTA